LGVLNICYICTFLEQQTHHIDQLTADVAWFAALNTLYQNIARSGPLDLLPEAATLEGALATQRHTEREFFIDNLLVRIHHMIWIF